MLWDTITVELERSNIAESLIGWDFTATHFGSIDVLS